MNKPYRLVIFDWEGTLGDTLGPLIHCLADTAECMGLGEFDSTFARRFIEFGLLTVIKKLFSNITSEQQIMLASTVQQTAYTRFNKAYLLPGAKNILSQLKKTSTMLAIATNKSEQSLKRALQQCKLSDFFQITRSAGILPAKPCPQMLIEILDSLGVSAQDALMIGDSAVDIEMANNINMDAIGVSFYHHQPQLLLAAGAMYVFNDYSLLASHLKLPN